MADSSAALDYGNMLFGKRRISKYDPIVKKYARRYGFDWRLISAQIYAESNFRNTAKSGVGALGLMQIMPSTAKHHGVNPDLLLKPEHNIRLGCYYNRWLYALWKDKKGKERLAFTFASYNAGRGRVLRTQSKVGSKKFKLVKPALPKETQNYVEKIFRKYHTYSMLIP